jgi:hypothetical protein
MPWGSSRGALCRGDNRWRGPRVRPRMAHRPPPAGLVACHGAHEAYRGAVDLTQTSIDIDGPLPMLESLSEILDKGAVPMRRSMRQPQTRAWD